MALWGAEDLLGPRAPGLAGTFEVFGHAIPQYDLFLIVAGPVVLVALTVLVTRTRFGMLIRAAAENRALTAALGIDQARLYTAVFALGAFLAGWPARCNCRANLPISAWTCPSSPTPSSSRSSADWDRFPARFSRRS